MDKSRGQANGLRDQADALTVLNTCEMADMGDSGGTGTRSDRCWRCKTPRSWARWPGKLVRCIEWAQGCARYSQQHEYDCRHNKKSVHIKIYHKCKTYLSMQEDVTKLSPEAVKACQTCTNTCMALQYMCIWLGTHKDVSVHAQRRQNHWTYLLGVQDCAETERWA